MPLSRVNNKKLIYLPMAFLMPFLGMCIVMLVRGFIPFGKVSMLYSDMYHQYYPFFVAFRKALRSGDSLLFNWSAGMGIDYLGLISYYLASPLNLLSVLIPEGFLLEYFSLLMPIKLGFAGLFFAIFLNKLFHKADFSIVLFGSLYALCAWALGYQWNIMWLDTFALLPLVALGTISVLQSRKFILYVLSLFFSIAANYYIGLFTCFFVVLICVAYEICRWKGFKKLFADVGYMVFYSVLAIGMTAFLELPAYAALQTTYSSVNKFPTTFQLNMTDDDTLTGLWKTMALVAGNTNGALKPTFKEGLPNLYCGVITNILAFLFISTKQVKFRDKLCSLFLLLFFNVSFIIRQLDYIWHGFHFTNMIPYRFSFLYSFVLLYMAYRAYLLRSRFRLWQVISTLLLAVTFAFCVEDLEDPVYWAYNGAFILMYGVALLYPFLQRRPKSYETIENKRQYVQNRKINRRISKFILWGMIVVEIALNLVNFGAAFTGTTVTDYPRGTIYTDGIIRYMEEREEGNLFYRTETTHSQTLNDGALNGYNGISAFTSSANVRVTRFMKALGYGAKDSYNRYCYEEASPVANLFLNIKYMLERQDKVEENPYFDDIQQFSKVHLLENVAYLPLGFLAEKELINLDFPTAGNVFIFQNELLATATGIPYDVWELLEGEDMIVTGKNANINTQNDSGYCSYTVDANQAGTVTYTYTPEQEGFMCISLNQSKKNKISLKKNGESLYNETYSIPQSLSVSQVSPGDTIEVQLTCAKGERGNITLNAAVLNEDLFWECYDVLNASTLQLTKFRNTRIEGTIHCDRDGVLYTSIPQNGNWRAIVDGKNARIETIGDAMVGVRLSAGDHKVVFVYHNAAFSLGWKVSLACAAVFLCLACGGYIKRKVRKNKIRIEKEGFYNDPTEQ